MTEELSLGGRVLFTFLGQDTKRPAYDRTLSSAPAMRENGEYHKKYRERKKLTFPRAVHP